MNKLWLWLMVLCVLVVGSASAVIVTGTGVALGFNDSIAVTLTLVDGVIKDVTIDHHDTAGIADLAISELSKAIVNNNSINVDVASGATLTSRGILEAAKNALIAAGLDPNDYMGEDHVTVLPGDPDGDGVVSIGDAIAVLQYCTGGNASLELRTADVTGDGKVDLHDALCILQYAAGWSVTLN